MKKVLPISIFAALILLSSCSDTTNSPTDSIITKSPIPESLPPHLSNELPIDYSALLESNIKSVVDILGTDYIVSSSVLDQYMLTYETETSKIDLITDIYVYDGRLSSDDETSIITSIYINGDIDVTGTGLMANALLKDAEYWCSENNIEYIRDTSNGDWRTTTYLSIDYNGITINMEWSDERSPADTTYMMTDAAFSDPTISSNFSDEYHPYDEYGGFQYGQAYTDEEIANKTLNEFHDKIVTQLKQTMSNPPSYLGILDSCTAESYTVYFDPDTNTYDITLNVRYGTNFLDVGLSGGSSVYVVNASYEDTGTNLICTSFAYS